jgi:hypothetical protein
MTKKKTTAMFIEDAIRTHGAKYDYSKTEYIKNSLKVKIICKEHGEFEQMANTHLRKEKHGCPKCSGCYRPSTNDFINRSKEIHGDNYDYSLVEYISGHKKVKIICKIHGEFEQMPVNHIGKQQSGCKKCSDANNGLNKRKLKEQFINEATTIHENFYDYSKVDYINSKTKIIIICKIHGEFEQEPNKHIGKQQQGCSKCTNCYKLNTFDFIEKSNKIHENKYDYSKVNYINTNKKVIIICSKHGEFEQTPNAHIQKQGCPKCSGNLKLTTEEFIKRATLLHKNLYDYTKTNYINTNTKIIIICKEHGEFQQTPDSHIGKQKQGCPKCFGNLKLTTEEFIKRATLLHKNLYDYTKTNYININTKIIIICKEHGEFEQTPDRHIGKQKQGCPKCNCKNYSNVALTWLKLISKLENINIQHALNGDEFTVPNTKYKADGYCKETNTIYEFHGDYWHGNPKIYNKEDKTYFNKTFGELYENTLKKEEIIRGLGYNLVVMWEMDFKRINKSIGIIQKKFKIKLL